MQLPQPSHKELYIRLKFNEINARSGYRELRAMLLAEYQGQQSGSSASSVPGDDEPPSISPQEPTVSKLLTSILGVAPKAGPACVVEQKQREYTGASKKESQSKHLSYPSLDGKFWLELLLPV